jgi:hypothetical protein
MYICLFMNELEQFWPYQAFGFDTACVRLYRGTSSKKSKLYKAPSRIISRSFITAITVTESVISPQQTMR